jgi:hypothetical protein
MTVNVETPIIKYVYTAPAELAFDFKVFAETDLVVRFVDSVGVVTELVLNTDYTVTLDPGLGGGDVDVTYVPPGGYSPTVYIHILRKLPLSQATNWVNNDPFNMDILENDLDRAIMLMQELYTDIDTIFGSSAWRGAWATATYYLVQSIVLAADDNYYVATQTHTSGTWATDLADGKWALFIDMGEITDSLASTFVGLTDTPASLSGQGLKDVRVNTGGTALEFYTPLIHNSFIAYNMTGLSAKTLDCAAYDVFRLHSMTINFTITLSNFAEGRTVIIVFDDAEGRTVTWPTILWANGEAPVWSASKELVTLTKIDSSVILGSYAGEIA